PWEAVRARQAQPAVRLSQYKSEVASDDLRAVNRFLTDDLLASASPEVSRGKELTVRDAVDRAAESVAERFKQRPLTEAAVRAVLAETYDSLGLTERGLPHAQAAAQLQLREHGPNHEATLAAQCKLGMLLAHLN